jgi:hypothetical protein
VTRGRPACGIPGTPTTKIADSILGEFPVTAPSAVAKECRMSLIAPQLRQERQALTIKLDVRLLTLLQHYAEFITSSPEYVLSQALLVAFGHDEQFRVWLVEHHPEDANRVRELASEKPPAEPVGRLRGRPAAWSRPASNSRTASSDQARKDAR